MKTLILFPAIGSSAGAAVTGGSPDGRRLPQFAEVRFQARAAVAVHVPGCDLARNIPALTGRKRAK